MPPLVLFLLPFAIPFSPSHSAAQSGAGEFPAVGASFAYKFENKRFYISVMHVDVSSAGSAAVRFKRGESDEMLELKQKLRPETLARIRQLYKVLNFLGSQEEYQNKKDFSHLGWITISERSGGQERSVRWNYTANEAMNELADIFRGIATQEIRLFDIDLAGQHQPLDLPAQLDGLEDELRLERITEPERLLAPLREIAGDDTLPLIARNHASRLIAGIEKKKFKSPFRGSEKR